MNPELNNRIKELLNSSKIILFMKGEKELPMCGFSANVVTILKSYNVEFSTYNILNDMEIREGLKDYSNWPTFPQLYVNGELIGGNDIISELHKEGELKNIIS